MNGQEVDLACAGSFTFFLLFSSSFLHILFPQILKVCIFQIDCRSLNLVSSNFLDNIGGANIVEMLQAEVRDLEK